MKDLTEIKLHGHLGKRIKKSLWKLAVNSVGEAINAINNITHDKLKKALLKDHKNNIKYHVLINERDFYHEKDLKVEDPQSITESELCIKGDYIKKIDIIPIIEGAGDGANIITIVVAIILIIIGTVLTIKGNPQVGVPMILAGLGLLAAGIQNLLTKPPKPGEVGAGVGSYMFNGPQNTSEEGNAVPIGYGRLIVGSQLISASYDVDYKSADPSDRPILTE